MTPHKVFAGGAAFVGILAACFVFMLLVIAGESFSARTEIGAQCPAEGEWKKPPVTAGDGNA